MNGKFIVGLVIIILLALASVGVYHFSERGQLALEEKKVEQEKQKKLGGGTWGECPPILSSTTLSEAHSPWIDISGAKKVSFFFRRDSHSSGNTNFVIYTSPINATNTRWTENLDIDTDVSDVYERLISNKSRTDSTSEPDLVNSVTLSATGIEQYFIEVGDMFQYVVASMNTETDGSGNVYLCQQY